MNKTISIVVLMLVSLVGSAFATIPTSCPQGSFLAGSDPVAFANAVSSTSGTVQDPTDAVGVNDGDFARISPTSPNSYLVLDMGAGEEVWDSVLLDLQIFGDDTEDDNGVDVYVSNDANSGFLFAGTVDGQGNDLVELPNSASSYRYVKIENDDNDKTVEIDAVKGFCITNPTHNDVPEFSTLGAGLVLAGAGAYLARKRK